MANLKDHTPAKAFAPQDGLHVGTKCRIYRCRMASVFSEGKQSPFLLRGHHAEDDNEMGAVHAGSDAEGSGQDGDKSWRCSGPLADAACPQAGLQSRFGNENWD